MKIAAQARFARAKIPSWYFCELSARSVDSENLALPDKFKRPIAVAMSLLNGRGRQIYSGPLGPRHRGSLRSCKNTFLVFL